MKPLLWMGSSKKDLQALPGDVQDVFGFALHLAQKGGKHPDAKMLKGFDGVLEIVDRHEGNAYRAVYAIKLEDAIYVLHCFQKKSNTGIKTPGPDLSIIGARLKTAIAQSKEAGSAKARKS